MLTNTAKLNLLKLALIAGSLLFVSGCSTLSKNDDPAKHISADPFESFNRKVDRFNYAADKAVLRPVAKAYDTIVPDPAQNGVRHFFDNLGEPLNIINNLLQGKVDGALSSTYRFVVNSTVGVLGIFDVAGAYDVVEESEDLGQTLAAWGVKPGPFIVIPLMGPSNLRDVSAGAVSNLGIDPINEVAETNQRVTLALLNVINTRARFLSADALLDNQIDPYLFLKSTFESNRVRAIYDGAPPKLDDVDEFEF